MPDTTDKKNESPLYKIGDVSKILGVSPDLLRYYEKKGIVKPHKDRWNDYRYYEAWDVNFLIECLWYKQYGFGMKDIETIVANSSYDNLEDILRTKEHEIVTNINYQEMLLKCLHTKIERLTQGKRHLGVCNIETSPAYIQVINRHNFRYDSSPDVENIESVWSGYFPFIDRCFSINIKSLIENGVDFDWGYAMPIAYVEALNVKEKPPIEYIAPCRCIHSVVRQEGKYGFSPKILNFMLDYASEHHFKINGNARGSLLCSVRENGVMTGYFEAWIPIR